MGRQIGRIQYFRGDLYVCVVPLVIIFRFWGGTRYSDGFRFVLCDHLDACIAIVQLM